MSGYQVAVQMAVKKLLTVIAGVYLSLSFSTSASADVQLSNGQVLSDSPMWIVTYIEVAYGSIEEAEQLLADHAKLSREEEGNLYFEAVQRIGRQNHFAIMEAWAHPEARARHAAQDHTIAHRHEIQPILYSPYDERVHVGLETIDPQSIAAGDSETVYVLTHLDFSPPEQFAPCNRRPDPNGPCGNDLVSGIAKDSRSHDGNMRFDVLTQTNRLNHMTVVEMWSDLASFEAHQIHPQKKDFRDAITGIEEGSGVHPDPQFTMTRLIGALWDERLYRLIDD